MFWIDQLNIPSLQLFSLLFSFLAALKGSERDRTKDRNGEKSEQNGKKIMTY